MIAQKLAVLLYVMCLIVAAPVFAAKQSQAAPTTSKYKHFHGQIFLTQRGFYIP